MVADERMRRHYELNDESARLWDSPRGELTRLRTWDIFDRFLPPSGRIADVGGGPGAHAAHLAALGYDVMLVDLVPHHVERAASLGRDAGFRAQLADARALPFADDVFDAVLLFGPLYHLAAAADRERALREAHRVLRPGGRLLAEIIGRYAWLLDASWRGLLGDEANFATFELNLRTGFSADPARTPDHVFWAYFHHPDEVKLEASAAGFTDVRLIAVEGFPWLLGNLAELLQDAPSLLRMIRMTEAEPSMLGISAHVMTLAAKPLA